MTTASGAGWRPQREVELLAGTPPGGGQDRAARALAVALEEAVDISVTVTNAPGLGGAKAWARLAGRSGDGHSLAISSPTLITNELTGVATTGTDSVTQIALLCTEYIAFAVPAGSQMATAGDLIDRLPTPERPDVSLATARGNVNHVALAYLCRHAATEPQNVDVRVFDSARHAIADVLDRDRGVVAVSAASVLPEIGAGTLRVLALSAPMRLGDPFAAVPTWNELGVDCTIGTWRGVVGPPGLAPATLAFWDQAANAAALAAAWRAALSRHMWSDTYLDAAAANRFMDEEEKRMRLALGELDLLDG